MFKHEEIKTVSMIWIFMMFSIFMYGFIVVIQSNNPKMMAQATDPDMYKMLLTVLSLMSLVTGGLSIAARRFLLKEKYYTSFLKSSNSAKGIYTVSSIISFALAETVAIYGLVLFFIGKNQNIFFSLAFVSIALIVFNKPSVKEYEDFKRKYEEKII